MVIDFLISTCSGWIISGIEALNVGVCMCYFIVFINCAMLRRSIDNAELAPNKRKKHKRIKEYPYYSYRKFSFRRWMYMGLNGAVSTVTLVVYRIHIFVDVIAFIPLLIAANITQNEILINICSYILLLAFFLSTLANCSHDRWEHLRY